MATRTPRTDNSDARLRRFSEETETKLKELETKIDRFAAPRAIITQAEENTVFIVKHEFSASNETRIKNLTEAYNQLVTEFAVLRRAYVESMQSFIDKRRGTLKRENTT